MFNDSTDAYQYTKDSCISFPDRKVTVNIFDVITITEDAFYFKGKEIQDAGRAYELFVSVMEGRDASA